MERDGRYPFPVVAQLVARLFFGSGNCDGYAGESTDRYIECLPRVPAPCTVSGDDDSIVDGGEVDEWIMETEIELLSGGVK